MKDVCEWVLQSCLTYCQDLMKYFNKHVFSSYCDVTSSFTSSHLLLDTLYFNIRKFEAECLEVIPHSADKAPLFIAVISSSGRSVKISPPRTCRNNQRQLGLDVLWWWTSVRMQFSSLLWLNVNTHMWANQSRTDGCCKSNDRANGKMYSRRWRRQKKLLIDLWSTCSCHVNQLFGLSGGM